MAHKNNAGFPTGQKRTLDLRGSGFHGGFRRTKFRRTTERARPNGARREKKPGLVQPKLIFLIQNRNGPHWGTPEGPKKRKSQLPGTTFLEKNLKAPETRGLEISAQISPFGGTRVFRFPGRRVSSLSSSGVFKKGVPLSLERRETPSWGLVPFPEKPPENPPGGGL